MRKRAKSSIFFIFQFIFLNLACSFRSHIPAYYKHKDESPEVNKVISADSLNLELLEWAIFAETNNQRIRLGLEPYKFDPNLQKAARLHSEEMVNLEYFDHYSPKPNNRTLQRRLHKEGIDNGIAGENIAVHPLVKKLEVVYMQISSLNSNSRYSWRNYGTPYSYKKFAEDLVKRWMMSPGHRNNILSPFFKYLGVGCAKAMFNNQEVIYVTQDFSSSNY